MNWDMAILFRRHATEITRSLRRWGISYEAAADLTQETFLRLMGATPRIDTQTGSPRAFLYRIARNLVIDHQRHERHVNFVHLQEDEFAALVDTAPSAETLVFDRQRLAISAAALDELPERTRLAFEMHRIDEMTIAEVAKELGLSNSRTWSLIRNAYRHIRQRLNENDI